MRGKAKVSGFSCVYGCSKDGGHEAGFPEVGGCALLTDKAIIYGHARILGGRLSKGIFGSTMLITGECPYGYVIADLNGNVYTFAYNEEREILVSGPGINVNTFKLADAIKDIEHSNPEAMEIFRAALELAKLQLARKEDGNE